MSAEPKPDSGDLSKKPLGGVAGRCDGQPGARAGTTGPDRGAETHLIPTRGAEKAAGVIREVFNDDGGPRSHGLAAAGALE